MPVVKKILGRSALAAATNTTVYTAPPDTVAAFNVSICNRGATAAKVRLALCDAGAGAPANADYLEYDFSLDANQAMERTGLTIDATKRVVAYADTANVSVVVTGQEQS